MSRKDQLIDYVDALGKAFLDVCERTTPLLETSAQQFIPSKNQLLASLREAELVVPVVGGFSTGKSTAINTFIGRDVLPVAITPETAIPTELRYGEEEYLLAIRSPGQQERHDIAALATLGKHAARYEIVQVFLNSPELKQIEPFVLVDMPGFDSPLDQHNKAILRYLAKGAYYLFLSNTGDGQLNKQDLRRIEEVRQLGRGFKVFLTKKDLCAENQIEEVKTFVEDQLDTMFDEAMAVDVFDHSDTTIMIEHLNNANPDTLFDSIHVDRIKDLFYSVDGALNTAINAINKEYEERKKYLAELEKTLAAVKNERERSLKAMESSAVSEIEQRMTSKVERELRSCIEELAVSARSGENALSRAISDIVRSVLISDLRNITDRFSKDIVGDYSQSMNFNTNVEFNFKQDWLDNMMKNLHTEVMNALLNASDINERTSPNMGDGLSKIFISLALIIPNPIFKIIVAILPGIIGQFFDKLSGENEKSKLIQLIDTQVIPSVIRQIKPDINNMLTVISKNMKQAVLEEFENKINEQRNIFNNQQKEFEKNEEKCNAYLDDIEKAKEEISSLTNSVLF